MQTTNKKRMLSIWSFVSFIFIIYGIVIAGSGIYYEFNPPTQTGLYHFNPTLWWGILLFIVGILFNWLDLKSSKK